MTAVHARLRVLMRMDDGTVEGDAAVFESLIRGRVGSGNAEGLQTTAFWAQVAAEVRVQRAVILNAAYTAHPGRFVRRAPIPPPLPGAAWIHKPKEEETTQKVPWGHASDRSTGSPLFHGSTRT